MHNSFGIREMLRTVEDRGNHREEVLLTQLVYRTFMACSNVARFHTARDTGDTKVVREIAADERDNALAARTIYSQAPWLDYPMRIDGVYSPAEDMIDEFLNPV